ncbi:MAG: aminofutalosine synthase MqnE, partial [Smithellaceae bacterium]|nr:aminofutalosine synthase MqnE [Smithellaceae bacterium]
MKITFRDNNLPPLWDKIEAGGRLTLEDGLTLFRSDDLIALGRMAREMNYRKNGDAVYYSLNQKIEPTNICRLQCRFCAFSVQPDDPGAYELSIPEILKKISPSIREVHITGALHPDRPWRYYLDLVAAIREKFPQVGIKAYTAVEIDYFHRQFGIPVKQVLKGLKNAGLDSLPGGGAEIFSQRVRLRLFPGKISAKRWLMIHRIAHLAGIPTNATMLYGHIETIEERLRHLIMLRELQDETGGFFSFIPLPFQPGQLGITPGNRATGGVDDLKTIAVSRLMLDNFPHVKAYWVMLTQEGASLALHFGADDLDGTVGGERIAHDAGADSPQSLARENLTGMIRETGRIAVERDVFYNPLRADGEDIIGKIPYLNSVPFYHYFPRQPFRLLPLAPRQMGILSRQGQIAAGPFSLMDYLAQGDGLTPLDYCIASPREVGSVLLFSKLPWVGLEGKDIGITDDTATSVRLLRVLLEQRYGVQARLRRLRSHERIYDPYQAVLLIGDEALRRRKSGLPGFPLVFDLAGEWFNWQQIPFVFAVWACDKELPEKKRQALAGTIDRSLRQAEGKMTALGARYCHRIGITPKEAAAYLAAFQYRLGEEEREAIRRFRG